ncbi:MAG: M60 family metallopeptidase [Bacteroidaceae bacterium]|nr:M60 family metallopeptidase [Bacteroidaceae bacterium]
MKRIYLLLLMLLSFIGNNYVNAQDITTGLVRVKSKRTSYYLSTANSGVATTTAKNLNTLNQVWILQASGDGYTFRSANTGEYLQADYAVPASGATTLYIRKSPNATGTAVFYNISSDKNFGGKFLNTNTSHNLFTYSFDDGCDWYLETVENYTEDEIKERILGMSPYAGELKDGAYYRIASYYDLYLTEGSDLTTKTLDKENLSQCWQLHKSGSGWTIQSVLTLKYIGNQTQNSTPYHMVTSAVEFNIVRVNDGWDYRWTIKVGSNSGGLHDSSSQGHNVVYWWDPAAAASEWHFVEAEITEEEIEAARAGQTAYEDLVANRSKLQKNLNNLFDNKACTTLKAEIQALTDEQLAANEDFAALNADMQSMVLKVKNNTWKQFASKSSDYTADYEKFFRVTDYHIYSNYQDMASSKNFQMSNPFGRLSNPTGIVANPGDIIYIYVDSNAKTGSELMLEAVSTDGVSGNHPTGEQTTLKSGLNLFRFSEQKMLYIFYQLSHVEGTVTRKLSLFPDICIHIEGGQLNGYWDATRGMTNADWKLLQQELLKAPFVNLKTERLVFQMDTPLVLEAEPNDIEGLTHIWNQICANEDRYMGVEDFDGIYNNIWNVFSGASSYMHSTNYGTWYTESTIPTVMNYDKMRRGGNIWGPSHEIGHNHQASINVIGATESSNNLFSNINVFEQGITASRRDGPTENFNQMVKGTPWSKRDIWLTTSMFYQLYLYFHAQHHDDQFLPNLFRTMRKNPINKGTSTSNVTYVNNEGNTVTGTINVASGSKDYLHLAKMICDVAEADLSEFFEAYGMFIPISKVHVGDYSNYLVTTTQSDIDAAKEYMQKYEKKLGNIMFIDDRVITHPAITDGPFDAIPDASGNRVPMSDEDKNQFLMKNANSTYYGGDYTLYTPNAEKSTDDWYKLSGNKKTMIFQGTNYAGHKFYDADGNLVWATNARTVTLPASVTNLGIENVTIVTANYDMTDTPCTNQNPADAINAIYDNNGDSGIYDLTGRRVAKAVKGLYIINGKKVVK